MCCIKSEDLLYSQLSKLKRKMDYSISITCIGFLIIFATVFIDAVEPTGVSLKIKDLSATLDNGLIKISFKNDATVSSLYKNGKNLVNNVYKNRTFYLDWVNTKYNTFTPSRLEVITKSPRRAHIMYLQDNPALIKLEYHIIMDAGQSGIYSYVKVTNNKRKSDFFVCLRLIYRFNPHIMHQITNGVQEGIPPLESQLRRSEVVQDTTWKLADGTIYSKYDYAGYVRDTYYQGVFGHGFGVWLLSASREYSSGGPLKQDLLVHQEALIINSMTTNHFGTPGLTAPSGWSKLYGPWMLYFNEGTDDEMKEDVKRRSDLEKESWPYKWMNETDYPLSRGTLNGKITGPSRSMVVLSSSLTEPFEIQTLGFSYSTETQKGGSFSIKNIRPGKYKFIAYPLEGYGIGAESEKLITIAEGINQDTLHLTVPTTVKWSIGETNRRSDIYRYCNENRNYIWHTLPPANLEFEIGKNNVHTEWYYAQSHKGTWSIKYKDIPNRRNRILRIGFAATSVNELGSPVIVVSVNGHLLKKFKYENDHSIYRSALQSGNFKAETIIIPAMFVIEGDNIISLGLQRGSVMYDSLNLSEDHV